MSVKSGDQKSVCLQPLNLMMKQSTEMTLFTITDHVLINVKEPERGIRMTIKMKRKILSEMMTTYFPSILLMMITYATTFFKPFFFEAALSVNLTTMLVMTTIFISKMEGLPPTSDIKMIDIWHVLCQMVPFAEVVILTAMEYQRIDDDIPMDMNIDSQEKENGCKRCWVAWLKTLGALNNTFVLKPKALILHFREKSSAVPGVGKLCNLFHNCNCLLF